MPYHAGELDQRVTFRREVPVPDEMGGHAHTWVDVATVWALIRPLSGREREHSQKLNAEAGYLIVIRNRTEKDAEIAVETARLKDPGSTPSAMAASSVGTSAAPTSSKADPGTLLGDFPRKLGDDVAIEVVYVNMIDHMDAAEARVRFYPNGTSDEFMVTFAHNGNRRTIKVDIITGAAWETTTQ